MTTTQNLRIESIKTLISPNEIMAKLPSTEAIRSVVQHSRQDIQNILDGKDDRLLVIIGPCSIHDPKSAIEYAQRLLKLRKQYEKDLCIVMRVYFEKPRTTIGWKGLINDPNLDQSFEINTGLQMARDLLLQINALGLPTATEFLDTIVPQYIADLVSWGAIGARTTESQIHREMASGLSMPVGFKNGTEGNIDIAIDATFAAKHPHHFLSVSADNNTAIVSTLGNPYSHVILRGGKQTGPNYHPETVNKTSEMLTRKKLSPKLMVDCSHGNSQKSHERQLKVIDSLCTQIKDNAPIFGMMIESHLTEGNQPLTTKDALIYGKSITDSCLGWEDTESLMEILANTIKTKRGTL